MRKSRFSEEQIIGIPSCRALARCFKYQKAPAEVIGEPVFEINDVVFNGHDLTVIGTAVRRSSEASANHLHVE